MSNLASSRPTDAKTATYYADQIREMRTIYEVLFPTQHLIFMLTAGQNPVWSHPEVIEGPYVPLYSDLGPYYLGSIDRPGSQPEAPEVTIRIEIPRLPTLGEKKQTEAPWRPIKGLGGLFRATPMVYEYLRYKIEMRRKHRADKHHDKSALTLGEGTTLISPVPKPQDDQRPSILIGMHWLETGGAEKLGFDTIRWAHKAGLRVFVVASVPTIQRLADRLPDHPDVTFIRLDRYLPHHLWPHYVEKLALAENIRLVHIHHCAPLYEALPLLRARLPWIKTIDSTHIIEFSNGGYPRISGVWSNFLDVQHVISKELVTYFCGTFQASSKKVLLGRMLDHVETADAPPPMRFLSGQKTLHVSFVGRLHYQKRPVVVVEILRALSTWAERNGVAFSATMLGEGPYEGTIVRLLRKYGLSSKVTQMPSDSDVPALLRRSDVLVLPSNNEGLALVCYEAITQGCIPISTKVGAQFELLPEDLLVPLAPQAAVRETVSVVDTMWRNADFLAKQKTALAEAWAQLSADPTSEDILMPIYRKAAGPIEREK